jgi:hypothetical protein
VKSDRKVDEDFNGTDEINNQSPFRQPSMRKAKKELLF